jgi:hypothetical protein
VFGRGGHSNSKAAFERSILRPSAGYTRLIVTDRGAIAAASATAWADDLVASEEKGASESAAPKARPADESCPSTQYRQVQRCTTLTRRGASIIAGEACQRALHHVMYHYRMCYGALPAGSGAAGAWCRDRSAVARSRPGEDGVWHQPEA